MFAIFGMVNYRAVLAVQMFVDVGTCFVIADMARRLLSPRAAKAAFLLATLCPFLASYAAAALTETLEIFFTALALDFAISGLTTDEGIGSWVGCGLATGGAILLRPDGGLLLAAIEFYLLMLLVRAWKGRRRAGTPASARALYISHYESWLDSRPGFAGAAGSVGLAQPAYSAPLSAACATLCQRGGRVCSRRI